MTTEYRDNVDDDSSSFWNKGVSRFRRWLFPGLTATMILILIIALGASNSSTWSRLWLAETRLSNVSESMVAVQKQVADTFHHLNFAVESNREQLSSVSDALKQLSQLDSIIKTVSALKCSLERHLQNASLTSGCCPVDWDLFESSCYLFSKTVLDWDKARDWCNSQESHLVVLMSDEEWNFVLGNSRGTFYWVGLTDQSGTWLWANQVPYTMNRRRWRPGQPDSWTHHGLGPGDEDCAHLHHDGRLNDLHCSTKLRFICQKHITAS